MQKESGLLRTSLKLSELNLLKQFQAGHLNIKYLISTYVMVSHDVLRL